MPINSLPSGRTTAGPEPFSPTPPAPARILRTILLMVIVVGSIATVAALYALWIVLPPGQCIAAALLGLATVAAAAKLLPPELA